MSTAPTPTPTPVSRRKFLQWSGLVGGAAVATTAVSGTLLRGTPGVGAAEAAEGTSTDPKFVWSACTVNCGSRCPLRLQVEDGRVIRVLPDDGGDNSIGSQQIRACVRGRSIRHRIYNPDRLKTPLKRKPGTKRGDGESLCVKWLWSGIMVNNASSMHAASALS